MKRFWLILLSLGLLVAFSTQAMAVDVKFSGEYYAAGMYLDKTTFKKDTATDGPSTAFYFQRLRLNTTFVISPGLTLTTRADIMERAWGTSRSNPGTGLDTMSAGTKAENENIAFDLAYVTYLSPVGLFTAGYQIHGVWGTVFGDNPLPTGTVAYIIKMGGFLGSIQTGKFVEGSRTATNPSLAADRDKSYLMMFGRYEWKGGEVGILGEYTLDATNRSIGLPGPLQDVGYLSSAIVLLPYAKVQLGPVALQAELNYLYGKATDWEGPYIGQPNMELNQLAGMVDALANFGMFYAGGTMAYVPGDDPGTKDKLEGGGLDGGIDWNPCLILFNSDLNYWAGGQAGHDGSANAGPMTNAWFFQLRAGVKPIDKLDIMASVSYANADKKPTAAWLYNDYGYEVDLSATYKITNNLSYMLGGGYLFAGKYYKGEADTNQIHDNFMVINKLTLTF